jgi:hypothetical protein
VDRKSAEEGGAAASWYLGADIRGATALPSTEVSSASAHHGKRTGETDPNRPVKILS